MTVAGRQEQAARYFWAEIFRTRQYFWVLFHPQCGFAQGVPTKILGTLTGEKFTVGIELEVSLHWCVNGESSARVGGLPAGSILIGARGRRR
jgi:hypothetical protein